MEEKNDKSKSVGTMSTMTPAVHGYVAQLSATGTKVHWPVRSQTGIQALGYAADQSQMSFN